MRNSVFDWLAGRDRGRDFEEIALASGGDAGALRGRSLSYRAQEYRVLERKGYRTVSWAEGPTVFSLVSMLDSEALLECADRLRAERAGRPRL